MPLVIPGTKAAAAGSRNSTGGRSGVTRSLIASTIAFFHGEKGQSWKEAVLSTRTFKNVGQRGSAKLDEARRLATRVVGQGVRGRP